MGNQIYFKIAGHVDLDKLNMFSVYTQHLSFIVFEISETAWQNGAKPDRKHLCKILYKASSFGSIRPTNMAAKINSFF
jgi:hypothetical protein